MKRINNKLTHHNLLEIIRVAITSIKPNIKIDRVYKATRPERQHSLHQFCAKSTQLSKDDGRHFNVFLLLALSAAQPSVTRRVNMLLR